MFILKGCRQWLRQIEVMSDSDLDAAQDIWYWAESLLKRY
jgi:hypothetical protein